MSLSADKNSLTLNVDYSDYSTKILASNDYEISWDISPDIAITPQDILDMDTDEIEKVTSVTTVTTLDLSKIEGCETLNDLDCSNNHLVRLNAYNFRNLSWLKCKNQYIYSLRRSLTMSLIDLFKGLLLASAAADEEVDVANVENLKAYDSSSKEISVEYNKKPAN